CPGEYEKKLIPHLARTKGNYLLIKDVPAEVCNICGDTLISREVTDKILELVKNAKPQESIPSMRFVA
ncbi:MAG: YgiT-type zinc finger protein, partial [Bacteroidota bacterium]|nr:YgiT-type zinc finger protein [Bacteroidota bacterium]